MRFRILNSLLMILEDNYNRLHNYLRISLTERCNLRCTYCMPEEGVNLTPNSMILTRNEIFEIAKTFVELGVTKIRLTGGEPLVRKDVAEIMKDLGTLPVSLTMTSNGVIIDRFLRAMEESGIRSLNLSLDTLDKERFKAITKRDDFGKVMSNINLLMEHEFHVKINVVLMKGTNDDEIPDFVEWTKDRGIHVRFIEFMPFDGNDWRWERIFPYREILETIQSKYDIAKLKDKQHATSKAFQVNGFKGTFAIISSMTNHFCSTCNRLRLTADGKMKNCLFSNDEVDLLTPFRDGEDIKPLIFDCLKRKLPRHGGIKELDKLTLDSSQISDRSMILIGG